MESKQWRKLGILGPAIPDAALLNNVVGFALGEPEVEVHTVGAYGIGSSVLNMTTGGLWRVYGSARPADSSLRTLAFSVVVKLIQSPLLWGGIERIPQEFRPGLVANYPWRTEAEVYASGLSDAMPLNSRLPKPFGVVEVGEDRAVIWMEDVVQDDHAEWSDEQFRDAAGVLGFLAGSTAVERCSEGIRDTRRPNRLKYFLAGVGKSVLIPAIKGHEIWSHPAVAANSDPALVSGLRSFADQSHLLVDEMMTLPALPAHGDACPQNLLTEGEDPVTGRTNFAVVDWGMFGQVCAGYDLAQLLAGRVNEGTMPGTALHRLEPICMDAYCAGLKAAGSTVSRNQVRRVLAISIAVFSGLTAV
ncbi:MULTISPECIES: hypothetical protein [unclassified Arthrobacter]|uniref:hypothetical protein n=1 Tax=unclassified Arthrobacter TaxID=235627 RepID=UPI00339B1603